MTHRSRHFVTHFEKRDAGQRWKRLKFYTTIHGFTNRYFEGLPSEEMARLTRDDLKELDGELIELPRQVEIFESQTLWLDEHGAVWIAREHDPVTDPNKKQIYPPPQQHSGHLQASISK